MRLTKLMPLHDTSKRKKKNCSFFINAEKRCKSDKLKITWFFFVLFFFRYPTKLSCCVWIWSHNDKGLILFSLSPAYSWLGFHTPITKMINLSERTRPSDTARTLLPSSVKSSTTRRPVGAIVYLNHLYTATCGPPTERPSSRDSSRNKRESIGPRDAFFSGPSPRDSLLLSCPSLSYPISARLSSYCRKEREKKATAKSRARRPMAAREES